MPKTGTRISEFLNPQTVIDRFFGEDWFVVFGLEGLGGLSDLLQSPCDDDQSAGSATPDTVPGICAGSIG